MLSLKANLIITLSNQKIRYNKYFVLWNCQKIIKKPVMDAQRFSRVWETHVISLKNSYESLIIQNDSGMDDLMIPISNIESYQFGRMTIS